MRTLIKLTGGIVALLVFVASQASAQIAAWDVAGQGTPFSTTLNAGTTAPNVTTPVVLSRGGGVLGNSAANSFAATNWNNTATFDENLSYYSFTVGPDAGFNLALTDLSFRVNGSNTLPNNGRWGYSIDAGSFVLGTGGDGGQMTMTLAGGLFSWDFTDFTVNDGSSAEFRFWVFGTTSVNGGTAVVGGSGRILNGSGNDLVLNGTVEAVPEPSTLSLIGFGILGMLAFARRRFSRS